MAETTDLKPPTTGERFFAWIRSLGISREPGWIGGVAAGVGTRLGIDPLIVRGILIVVAVLGGPALLLYAAAWLLLPDVDDKIHLEETIKGSWEPAVAGIGVMVLLALLPVSQGFWFAGSAWWSGDYWTGGIGRALWTLFLIGAATAFVIWLANRGKSPSAPRPAPPVPPTQSAPAEDFAAWREQQAAWKAENEAFRKNEASAKAAAWREHTQRQHEQHLKMRKQRAEERRLTTPHPLFSFVVIGIALIAGGLTTLTIRGGEIEVSSVVAGLAVALGVLGLAIIVNGVRGKRSSGPGAVAGWLILPLAFVLIVPQTSHVQYSGMAEFSPSSTSGSIPDAYFVGIGDTVLDLRDYYKDDPDSRGTDDVYLFAWSSGVTVLLPADETVLVDSRVAADDGINYVDRTGASAVASDEFSQTEPGSKRTIEVHLYIAEGSVTIMEESE